MDTGATDRLRSAPLVSTALEGWRLWRLELCNWGTFHGKVWAVNPRAGWSLLVGENGSGKSTAVDALRTLLVPPRLLNYNDASGTQSRRDRNRVSYIRGAWGATAAEESYVAKTEYLRREGELSLLLAVFRRATTDAVTLAQVLWTTDGRPDELFLIAPEEFSIRTHLSELKGSKRELRNELRRRGWDTHDSFSAYAAAFRPFLGLPGDGALEVFNQAIGVKEVEDVNRFVRRHLLERGDALSFIKETLTPLYRELLACWERIQRAERQIAALRPVADAHKKAEEARQKSSETNELLRLLRPYYFYIEHRLRRDLAAELSGRCRELEEQKEQQEKAQTADQTARDQLRAELDAGELGLRLKKLEIDIEAAAQKASQRAAELKRLEPHLKVLGAALVFHRAAELDELKKVSREKRAAIEAAREARQGEQLRYLQDQQSSADEIKRTLAALKSLKEHRVNIDDRYLEVRQTVARDAGVPAGDLPFAGELMEVGQEFREWTGAIERLLRTFALSLLVPENHYERVTRLINRTHWGLRLQYFRAPADAPQTSPVPSSRAARQVSDRLVFREHALGSWVAAEIRRAFPHVCCANEQELGAHAYGLTREGLSRSGSRHVKDDRRHVDDATNYVLGWSVEDKLRALYARLEEAQKAQATASESAQRAGREVAESDRKLNAIDAVIAVATFADIDLDGAHREVLRLKRQHSELEQSSERRLELKRQLAEIEREIAKRKDELSLIDQDIGKNKLAVSSNHSRLEATARELANHTDIDLSEREMVFADLCDGAIPTLDTLDQIRDSTDKRLHRRLERQNKNERDAINEMLPAMATFLREYPEFDKSLAPKAEYAADLVQLLARVEREELPAHRSRFEEYLSTNLVGNVAMFNSRLEQQLQAARERIAAVNASLRQIPFTATTYVQIVDRLVTGGEIAAFKARLRECVSGGIHPTPDDRLRIFHSVRTLLDDFAEKPDWAERVTDIRNWVEFGVRELARADDRQVDYVSASSGKSGGQKARLAFSILASAILSQYGLADGTTSRENAFRLVVIDEVFSRTDEENSRRALDLFRKLDLQLIVVSPFDAKARIVEDYVDSFHLALNPDRNCSSIQWASREQYEQAWQETARSHRAS